MVEIADILSLDDVVLDLRSCRSKRQVLKELAERAAAAAHLDPQRLLEALMERERLGTTGIGHGIAIPHARLAELTRLVGLFARLDEPVDFEALDDRPSDLIFLLLAPDSADAESLKALARISRLLRDPNVQQRLRQEKDRDAVYRMLTQKPESHAA
ncbi:MAG: PTS sugar transporter subunit IIA [Geminicoccaceae bacterium]